MTNPQLFYEDLSNIEKKIFDKYKANSPFNNKECFADVLNDSFRKNMNIGIEWELAAYCLDHIIRKNQCDEEITLYRATFEDFVTLFIKKDIYRYPAYMSTATSLERTHRHFANGFPERTPALLEIKCPEGTKMAPMEGNEAFGGQEAEMLLGRDGNYRLVGKRDVINKNEIETLMSRYYAKDVSKLVKYRFDFLRYD